MAFPEIFEDLERLLSRDDSSEDLDRLLTLDDTSEDLDLVLSKDDAYNAIYCQQSQTTSSNETMYRFQAYEPQLNRQL